MTQSEILLIADSIIKTFEKLDKKNQLSFASLEIAELYDQIVDEFKLINSEIKIDKSKHSTLNRSVDSSSSSIFDIAVGCRIIVSVLKKN
jgi:hypothetical protein